ncbi:MAG: flippase-like domain-containing protein [Cyclobacteriaceae bacterium]|nr:flippase-like domain-containing protein [Cyclobacteriaceae bacterium]
MQDSHITPLKKAVVSPAFWFCTKVLLLLFLLGYVAVELFYQQDLAQQFDRLGYSLIQRGWSPVYLLVLLLVPLNWFLEILKWRTLLRPLTSISLVRAAKGVLTGLSLGFMTPHSLGDYLGRVGHLQHENRMESLGAILFGRGAQFISTLLFGLVGLWAWYRAENTLWVLLVFCGCLLGMTTLLGMFLLAREPFVRGCKRYWPSAHKFIKVMSQYSLREVWAVFGYSCLRYMVFASQFLLLLYWLQTPLPLTVLGAGVTWVLLAKSVIPAFNFLSDLGVREFSALYFFGLYAISPAPVLTASLSIWILNILIPTLVGAVFIIPMKLTKP